MLSVILFFIFMFLTGCGYFLFKKKREKDIFGSLKEKIDSLVAFGRKLFEKRDKQAEAIQEREAYLKMIEEEELLKNSVSGQAIKSMGLDLRELRKLSAIEQQFRSKVIKHIVNNRLIYKEDGRLKMIIPLEAMTFLHKNLSPLVNNKGEITLSIKEKKCKIDLNEIDSIEFREFLMLNGFSEEIYNNKREREVAINTARVFYYKEKKENEEKENSNIKEEQKEQEQLLITKKDSAEVKSVTPPQQDEIIENKKEIQETKIKEETTTKNNSTDFLDEMIKLKPKSINENVDIDSKTALNIISSKSDDDYIVKKPEKGKEKKSVADMKKHMSMKIDDADIDALVEKEANNIKEIFGVKPTKEEIKPEEQLDSGINVEHGADENEVDTLLGAVKDIPQNLQKSNEEEKTFTISEDEMQQAYEQMAEASSNNSWGEDEEENTFSEKDFKDSILPPTDQEKGNEDNDDEEIGEISKTKVKKQSNNRLIELVHNKPFGEPGSLITKVDFKKAFSIYFEKSKELRKALAINIVKTKPIILNDNKEIMFIGQYQLAVALCKLFAPDEDKYYKQVEQLLKAKKDAQNTLLKDKFNIECKNVILSLSNGNNSDVFTERNIENLYFIDKHGKSYYSLGWRVNPRILSIAFEGLEMAENVLSFSKWLSEPLNDNISMATNLSLMDKENQKPLLTAIDESLFVK